MNTTAWLVLIVGALVAMVLLYLVIRTAVIHAINATRQDAQKRV